MSDTNDDQTPSPAPRRQTSTAWFVVVPAIALLIGALLGGLVVGVAGGGSGGDGDDAAEPSPSPSSTGPSTAVVVPDSCLESAETVNEAISVIRQGVGAIQNFEPDTLIDLLNQLEDLDSQAREQAATCTGSSVTDIGEPTDDAGEDATEAPSEDTSDGTDEVPSTEPTDAPSETP